MAILERDDVSARLAAALDAVAGGEGRFLVVEGPPGIGKTELVDRCRALAGQRGFGRLTATGDQAEQALPWGVVRQLVERSVLRYSGATRAAILAGPAGTALRAIESAGDDTDEKDLHRTLHALWWVAADLVADRPLLITVDDLQWADEPSLSFIGYLARRLADLPIALVVATRPPGTSTGRLAELTGARSGERLLPRALSPDALAVLAADGHRAPAPEVVTALHAASGGNPFLAKQLLTELAARGLDTTDRGTAAEVAGLGPRSVSRALLARLSPDASAFAAASAVLGVRSDPALAARVAEMDTTRAAGAADELTRVFVLVDDGLEFRFAHPVIREAVLAELPSAERAALHAKAASELLAAGAPAPRVAAHLVLSPKGALDGETARAVLVSAGRALSAEGVAETAVAYLDRALELAPDDDALLADTGTALLAAGRFAEAHARLCAAADATADPLLRAERLATASDATLRLEGPAAAARELRARLDEFDPVTGLCLEVRLGAASAYVPGEFERSGARLRRFADLPGATADERTMLALVAQRAFAEVRPAHEVRDLVARALDVPGLRRRDFRDGVAWGSALHAVAMADGIDIAERVLDRIRAVALPGGSPLDFMAVSIVTAIVAWRTGDVAACETGAALVTEALVLAEPSPLATALAAIGTRLTVLAALARDDVESARAALRAFDAIPRTGRPTVPGNRLLLARAALALACDDPALAAREAHALGAAERAAGCDNPAVDWRVPATAAALRLGDHATARALAEEQDALARRWGTATDLGAALRLRAQVEPDSRLELLAEACRVLADAPGRLERAAAAGDFGEALRAAGEPTESRRWLHVAVETAEACGAVRLRRRALDALDRMGDRPRRPDTGGAATLTASERRVAQLAVSGRSNREIAQEIFVTPKTVENHLGRVYQKLGIRSRRELTDALA